MERVVIESPYAGNIKMNETYGELAMHDCLVNHNEAPYASHLLYTRKHVLKDSDPKERSLGIEAGFVWRNVSNKSVFYIDLGISRGMQLGIEDCIQKDTPYEIRRLPDNLWNIFVCFCIDYGYGAPERINE